MSENDTPADPNKAAAKQGASTDDLDPATTGGGNPAPAEPTNKPPADDPDLGKTKEGEDDADAKAKEDADAEAAEAAEAAAKAEEDAKNKPLDTDVWGTTGDDVGDSVMTLLQNGGVTVEEAKALLYDAVQTGDATKIDKAALAEKVGAATANIILTGAETYLNRVKDRAATIVKEVHDAVGGEDNWNAVTAWAKDNVPAAEMADYRDLIDAGGAKARFAAQELSNRYGGDNNNTTLDTTELQGDAKATPTNRATTRAEYVSEMEKAHDSGASEAVINEIKAARSRGRAKGI